MNLSEETMNFNKISQKTAQSNFLNIISNDFVKNMLPVSYFNFSQNNASCTLEVPERYEKWLPFLIFG